MWNLDDCRHYERVLDAKIPYAYTHGDARAAHRDRDKREKIREAVAENVQDIPHRLYEGSKWAF